MADENQCYEQCVHVSLAVVPENGEDSFTFHRDARSGFLCLADGCGGLGARRYANMDGHTGAYLASRIVTECLARWEAQGAIQIPQTKEEGKALCELLAKHLSEEMKILSLILTCGLI